MVALSCDVAVGPSHSGVTQKCGGDGGGTTRGRAIVGGRVNGAATKRSDKNPPRVLSTVFHPCGNSRMRSLADRYPDNWPRRPANQLVLFQERAPGRQT